MVTVANICDRLRQHWEEIEGEPCPDEALKRLSMALVHLTAGKLEDLVQRMPPDRREERREDLLTLQAEFRSEAELIQQCLAEWRARAQERGCSPEEAQREAFIVLVRGFTWAAALPPLDPSRRYRLRDIRERIRRKLLVSGIPDEGALLIICRVLLEFVSDRSGLSLRLVSTEPAYWSGNAEGVFDRLYHQFEEDLDLLERELGRLAKATRHLSGPAFQRLLTRRLNREFLDQRRR